MIIRSNGKQSVSVGAVKTCSQWAKNEWLFCQNGYQAAGVNVSVEQFDMLKELVTDPEIVEHYEKLRSKTVHIVYSFGSV